MAERGWTAIDAIARQAKRSAFAETKRGLKITRERARNASVTAVNLTEKLWRRAGAVQRRLEHQLYRFQDSKKRFDTYRAEWTVEREIRRTVSGSDPLIVGPWLSEVGYEVLYWIPFLRRLQFDYHINPERLVIVTRGGAAAWYQDIATKSVELFDLMTPEEYAERNARRSAEGTGTLKQWLVSPMDHDILEMVRKRIGVPSARVLHPSLMYRLFQYFWLGHRPAYFHERRTRYRRITLPRIELPPLPAEYVAVKFYAAASLPPSDWLRQALRSLVTALAERTPVVMLDTGLAVDDHDEYTFGAASRVYSVRESLRPSDNLAVQSGIIAGARAFVGTCGSLAWLAPMLGIDTTAILSEMKFLHSHLQVGRRVYQTLGGGRFSPLDVSALDQMGMTLAPLPSQQPTE